MEPAIPIKVVIIGDSGVGKTSLALRFVKDTFSEDEPATIMGAYHEAEREFNNKLVKFVIWDTAGQERFQSITPLYYRGAQAAIIVYDITCETSYRNVPRWYEQLMKNSRSIQVVITCGNKCDCEDRREVTTDQGSLMASNLDLCFHETSAYDGSNVEGVFQDILCTLFEKEHDQRNMVSPGGGENTVKLGKPQKKKKRKIKFCQSGVPSEAVMESSGKRGT